MSDRPRIVVVGSINLDLVVECENLALPGQTVLADSLAENPGGKGANQAVAAARAGGNVSMMGRVGDDAHAQTLIDSLKSQNINTRQVARSKNCASGLAIVAVERSGQNSIIVVPGANDRITENDIMDGADIIRQADYLLVQLEIPTATVLAATRLARDAGVPVILDPAPMRDSLPPDLFAVDIVCPNQSEAELIVGQPIRSIDAATAAIATLHQRGARLAIITMGELGAVASDGNQTEWIEPAQIEVVDTTAAGDAFAGALAVRLAEGESIFTAAKFASAAGAIAATSIGAQTAMPTRAEIDKMARSLNRTVD